MLREYKMIFNVGKLNLHKQILSPGEGHHEQNVSTPRSFFRGISKHYNES